MKEWTDPSVGGEQREEKKKKKRGFFKDSHGQTFPRVGTRSHKAVKNNATEKKKKNRGGELCEHA